MGRAPGVARGSGGGAGIAGRAAGVGACVLVRTGKGGDTEPVARSLGLLDAAIHSVADLPGWLESR
jgi:hypothetical protein